MSLNGPAPPGCHPTAHRKSPYCSLSDCPRRFTVCCCTLGAFFSGFSLFLIKATTWPRVSLPTTELPGYWQDHGLPSRPLNIISQQVDTVIYFLKSILCTQRAGSSAVRTRYGCCFTCCCFRFFYRGGERSFPFLLLKQTK